MLLLLVIASRTYANDSKKYEQSINEIAQKIKRTSETLNANKTLRDTEREKLLAVEKKLSDIDKSIQKIDYEVAKTTHESEGLALQISTLETKQEDNRVALRTLIINRYKNGEGNYLKSLLDQQNPYAVGRLNNYHNYFSNALNTRFSRLSVQAVEYAKLQEQHKNTIDRLKSQRLESRELVEEYSNIKKKRAQSIAKLDKKIANNAESIKTLEGDRDRLQTLLTQLKKQAAELRRLDELRAKKEAERLARERLEQKKNKKKPSNSSKPVVRKLVKGGFLKQKGRLSYPVTAKPVRNFGSRMPQSGMRSEGTFFQTKGSVSVKTIFRGRVLFADFLKGFGLLIIVDHGDDHISLYGHNDRLLKKVGDVVDTGDVIAKTGVTGGLKSHGLYFEIRNNATPIDASKWCK